MLLNLYFKTTCNIRPHFHSYTGGPKIEGALYWNELMNKIHASLCTWWTDSWIIPGHPPDACFTAKFPAKNILIHGHPQNALWCCLSLSFVIAAIIMLKVKFFFCCICLYGDPYVNHIRMTVIKTRITDHIVNRDRGVWSWYVDSNHGMVHNNNNIGKNCSNTVVYLIPCLRWKHSFESIIGSQSTYNETMKSNPLWTACGSTQHQVHGIHNVHGDCVHFWDKTKFTRMNNYGQLGHCYNFLFWNSPNKFLANIKELTVRYHNIPVVHGIWSQFLIPRAHLNHFKIIPVGYDGHEREG